MSSPELQVVAEEIHFQVPPCAEYGAHSTNLEIYSGGFPPATSTTVTGEIVEMPEASAVLKLLLHYMHNERQPDSSKITFNVLYPLAEAVEKYMVFSAMEVFSREAIPQHPVEVLSYSIKHDYPELAKIALPLTVPMSFEEINEVLKDRPDIVLKWVEYREPWFDVLKSIYKEPVTGKQHKGGFSECGVWAAFYRGTLQEVAGDVGMAQKFSSVVQRNQHYIQSCHYCTSRASAWVRAVEDRMPAPPDISWLRG
ncbi:uncharacterized protein LACBIDRAFT_294451 [Laccaria bicolor S238N-H82]|uniref:Predicted protein n=1 Tax=Laccaria bicolor (strain S238N-H82 / ATCC MYA-4686) TaxID=486041 RepID=B0DBW1_LACBS|nr:uncharacterized protein LACBIDRAFT_294451 [Laccaria bicolor S238N-H82]EDR07785.1 predicted protein [Laccaria bicolor S238N-H82]|eukprot:XP_001881574.1 predicted protein [Laccaria bicolor S238N-H82]